MHVGQLLDVLLVLVKVDGPQFVNEILPAGEEDHRSRVIAVVLVGKHDSLLAQRAYKLRALPLPALLDSAPVLLDVPLGIPPEGRLHAQLQEELGGGNEHRNASSKELVEGSRHVVLRDSDHGLELRRLLRPVVPPVVDPEPLGAEEGGNAKAHLVVEESVVLPLVARSSHHPPVRHQDHLLVPRPHLLLVVHGVHSWREQKTRSSARALLPPSLPPGPLVPDAGKIDHLSMRPVDPAPVLRVPALEHVAHDEPDVGPGGRLLHQLVERLVGEVGPNHLLLRKLKVDVLVGEVEAVADVEEEGLAPALLLKEGPCHGSRVGDKDHVEGEEEAAVSLPHQQRPLLVHVVVEARAVRIHVHPVVEVKRLDVDAGEAAENGGDLCGQAAMAGDMQDTGGGPLERAPDPFLLLFSAGRLRRYLPPCTLTVNGIGACGSGRNADADKRDERRSGEGSLTDGSVAERVTCTEGHKRVGTAVIMAAAAQDEEVAVLTGLVESSCFPPQREVYQHVVHSLLYASSNMECELRAVGF
eukprot:766653-Hanusia_phi.AAC.4